MKKTYAKVGGQAILEGVMMRSPTSLAIAVRRPNGDISIKEDVWRSIWEKLKFLRWPFLRGTVVMIEAMVNGIQALNFSAREAMTEEEKAEDAESGASGGLALGLSMALGVVMAIALFKALPHLAATYAGELFLGNALTVDDVLYHVVDGLVKVGIFIGYVFAIGQMNDIKRVFMYHGAEHMSIHTLEAGEELNVENARKKSRLHPRCGTAFLMVVILVFIVVAAIFMPYLPEWTKPGDGKPWYTHVLLVLFKLPLLIPVAGVAYEFNRLAGRYADKAWMKVFLWPGMLMQLLTTNQPTDDQLEIGLAALRVALWREKVGDTGEESQGDTKVYSTYEAFNASIEGSKLQKVAS